MIKIVNGVEVALNEEEISAINAESTVLKEDLIRNQRNALLKQSDAYALADRITDEWTTYRQALRDVPGQASFPRSITWPVKPA